MCKIAILFAGQGSQYQGMGKEIYECSCFAKNLFDFAENIRHNTKEECFFADKSVLSITKNTQPDLFLVDLACYYALIERGIVADYLAGFSLGEIPAICASGLLNVEDAFKLVIKRAEFMDKCSGVGGMYAIIGIDAKKVENALLEFNNVFAVNYNSPMQTVISGNENLEKAAIKLKNEGAKVIKLNVSGAFHSCYMDEASKNMQDYLKLLNFKKMDIPVFSNYTAKIYSDSVEEISTNIYKQINNSVKWTQIIEDLKNKGVDIFIEVGTGKTLSGLLKKIIPSAKVFNVEDKNSLENTILSLKKEGITVNE